MSLEESALNYIRNLGTPWHGLFQTVAGLNLASLRLKDDLLTERSIDRTQPGFGDFDPASRRAIVPGDPASSFLYHALASPLVKPASAAVTYPQVADLDLIENYILSLAPLPASAIPVDAVIAVFAYEYRPAPATTHRHRPILSIRGQAYRASARKLRNGTAPIAAGRISPPGRNASQSCRPAMPPSWPCRGGARRAGSPCWVILRTTTRTASSCCRCANCSRTRAASLAPS